jgi:hypothetical protein
VKNVGILAAGIIITSLSAAALSACSSGGSPNAASILKSNGYTQVSTSQLNTQVNSLPAADVSSAAVGVSTSDSSEFQLVMVLTSTGVSQASSGLSAEESKAQAVGVKMSLNGDVLTMTGTGQAFSALPG